MALKKGNIEIQFTYLPIYLYQIQNSVKITIGGHRREETVMTRLGHGA